ncbi:S24 family peptidase [Microbulbifer sp. DLAB2-AF]|uniref:S24 family peptidase n=1 Tax=Microbulbifer sp. DLAB2-AF TaxID=3243395 RepID=UPI004039ED4F
MTKRRQLTPEEKASTQRLRDIWDKRRKVLGLTQEKAAHLLGWSSQSAVGAYLQGRIPLNTDATIKFAELLEVEPAEIDPNLGMKWAISHSYSPEKTNFATGLAEQPCAEQEGNVTPGPAIRGRVPLISSVTAGQWREVVDNFQPGDAEEWRETTANVGPHAFALRVEGDSMTAPTGISIPHGSVVIVDPDTEARNGSIVVAKLVDIQEATLKKLVIDGPNSYLRPLNPLYTPIPINGNCRIIGVARKVELDL